MLCELSLDHHRITVTAVAQRVEGFQQITKCEHCGGWNGINYVMRQQAA